MSQDALDDLTRAAAGDLAALDRVLPLIYARIREIAAQVLDGDRVARWVQASSLVQRAMLRLLDQRTVDTADSARVMAVLTTIMRRIVIDVARRETAQKRGGGVPHVSLHGDVALPGQEPPRIDAIEVEDSLVALAAVDAEAARVAELRLWGGMEFAQIALATGLATSRVRTLWNRAKAWLARDLRDAGHAGDAGDAGEHADVADHGGHAA